MESTSVYWTTIYFILEEAGIEVCLVNPKKFRMVPGRKTDIADCQWLQTLHLYGLLRGSFHPPQQIAMLRSYMRERDNAILQIISEVGIDMSKFPDAHHFASHLGFVPHNKITGGHVISSRTDRIKSSAAQAFQKLIPSISQTKTALGAFYRRLAPRIGKAQAITASCRKLAILFYNTLAYGNAYMEQGELMYQQKQEKWERRKLLNLAKKFNCSIVKNKT
jgi:transposase